MSEGFDSRPWTSHALGSGHVPPLEMSDPLAVEYGRHRLPMFPPSYSCEIVTR